MNTINNLDIHYRTSMEVAAAFQLSHCVVINDIEAFIKKDSKLSKKTFILSTFLDSDNQEAKMYYLDLEGFLYLITSKSYKFNKHCLRELSKKNQNIFNL